MIDKVLHYVKENNIIAKKDRIVIGVSGGADSVCLFFVMLKLKEIYDLHLEVVHVNHGIRGEEAKEDEDYVRELCEREDVSYTVFHEDVRRIAKEQKLSEEEAGRDVRYEAFHKVCEIKQCNKIAIAHNMNDSAETILFNLFRGSGIKGLTGILPVRDSIIRPLLCVSREEIEDYLDQIRVDYKIDKTNLLEEYTRNKIRLNILPYVKSELNERAMEHIASSGNLLSEVVAYIEKNMFECYERIVVFNEEKKEYFIQVNAIMKEDIVIQKELIRYILFQLSGQRKDIDGKHIDIIVSLLRKNVGKKVDLPYEIEVVRDYERIIFRKRNKPINKCDNKDQSSINESFKEINSKYESSCTNIHPVKSYVNSTDNMDNNRDLQEGIVVSIPGTYYDSYHKWNLKFELINYKKNLIIPTNGCTKWFDYDRIKNTVLLRTRKEGDFLQIDQLGGRKKLKSFFIDKKVPRELRDEIPLLTDGSHIMWIVGDRISEAYKVNEKTQRILIVKVDGGNKNG